VKISDNHRKYFEAIGLAEIRRELVVGSVNYLGIDSDPRRIAAREWVVEQEATIAREKDAAEAVERKRHGQILGWTIAGLP
jgi:hypothetical protein